MKQSMLVTCALVAALAFPALASAQAGHVANSPKAEFHLSRPLTVGNETLKPGDYKFQCKKIDGQEFLVITSSDNGREVARVPCKPVDLQAKITVSDFRSVPVPNGSPALSAVRIKGETVAHRVVTE